MRTWTKGDHLHLVNFKDDGFSAADGGEKSLMRVGPDSA